MDKKIKSDEEYFKSIEGIKKDQLNLFPKDILSFFLQIQTEILLDIRRELFNLKNKRKR